MLPIGEIIGGMPFGESTFGEMPGNHVISCIAVVGIADGFSINIDKNEKVQGFYLSRSPV